MKSPVLAVVVLLLVIAVGSLLWFSGDHGASTAAPSNGSASGAAASVGPELARGSGSADDKLVAPAADTVAPRADATEAEHGLGGEVRGIVRAPVCADDGPIEVYALSESGGIDLLFAVLARDAKVDPTDIDRARGVRVVAHARVGADLRFALHVPAEIKSVHLLLAGHYWFTPESTVCAITPEAPPIELAPRCGTAIAGTVVPPSGVDATAVEGLVVRATTTFDASTRLSPGMTVTNRITRVENGSFEVRALDAHGGYTLAVVPEQLAAVETGVQDFVAGRDRTVRLVLQRGGTVRGIVRDGNGAPIVAAKVEAQLEGRWFGFDNRTVRKTTSRDGGAYELTAVTPGSVVLVAEAEGFLANPPKRIDVGDGAAASGVDIELGTGKSITGSVTWPDGTPAAGVAIDVEFDKSQQYGMTAFNAARGAEGHAKSGADGKFTVTALGSGPFTVRAEALADDDKKALSGAADAAKAARKMRARADGVKPGKRELALVLRPPTGVMGHVKDSAGQAIESFHVHAEREGKGLLGSLGQPSSDIAVKDARGEFLLQLELEGVWKVIASADGFAPSDPVDVAAPRADDAAPIEIALVRGATVKGWVKNPTGQPFPGAEVEISNGEPKWKRALGGSKTPRVTSTPEGRFELDNVKPGKLALVASAKDWASSAPDAVDLGPGDTADNVILVLREGGKLTGEVYDDGKPASGMLVQATDMRAFDQKMANSDAQGHFTIEHIEPGTYQVVAMPTAALGTQSGQRDGEKSGEKVDDASAMMAKMKMGSATINDGQETHVVLGAPPVDPIVVHGRVTHAGEPYAGAMVAFAGGGKKTAMAGKFVKIGADGGYTITLEKSGDYDVTVFKMTGKPGEQNTIEFARTIPQTKDFVLDLAMPTARISGHVRTPEGEPAAGVRISLRPESTLEIGTLWGGAYQEGSADAEGGYDLVALRPGTYTLFVGGLPMLGMMGGEADFGREIRPGLKLTEGEWMRDVDVRLKKPGAAEVTVIDDAGLPVEGAAVFARDEEGRLLESFSGITTGATGIAKHGGLSPGRYTFSARKLGLASGESGKISIDGGDVKPVRIALSTGTLLWVRVVDADEKPIASDVRVADESGHEVGLMLSLADIMEMMQQGGFQPEERKIGPLTAGKYVVRVVRQGGAQLQKTVTLAGSADVHVKLQFEK